METLVKNAIPIAVILIVIFILHCLEAKGRHRGIVRLINLAAHGILVAYLLICGASMNELLLVLLASTAVAII